MLAPLVLAVVVASASPVFTADASAGLSWSVSTSACAKDKPASVRVALVRAGAPVASAVVDGVALACPIGAPHASAAHWANDAIDVDAGANEQDRGVLTIASLALGGDRRALVTSYESGFESIAHERVLYVEVNGKLERAWHQSDAGFEMGTVVHEWSVEPLDANGAEHLALALQHIHNDDAPPLERMRIGWDSAHEKLTSERLDYAAVVVGSAATRDDARALSESDKSCGMFDAVVPASALPSEAVSAHKLKAFVIVAPAASKKSADEDLAKTLRACAPSAFVVAMKAR